MKLRGTCVNGWQTETWINIKTTIIAKCYTVSRGDLCSEQATEYNILITF